MWLPKAYAVLNTELAALFAALMTKVGAYALIRFFTLLFDQHNDLIHPLLATMAAITMVIGAIGVIAYKDIKKDCSLPSHNLNRIYHFRFRNKHVCRY